MDHTFANETYATERYLLGEMQPEERDEFEEHFFSCRSCGEDIQIGSTLVENAKSVFRDEAGGKAPSAARRGLLNGFLSMDWLRWLRLPVTAPAFAALAMAGIVVYQSAVTIPSLKAPKSMAAPIVLDGETRSALPRKEAGKPLRFQMMLARSAAGDRVEVELLDAAGKTVRSGMVEAPEASDPLDVYFPGRLEPGRYSLLARSAGGNNAGQELVRNSFEIIEPANQPGGRSK
jgi:hypothetical protein